MVFAPVNSTKPNPPGRPETYLSKDPQVSRTARQELSTGDWAHQAHRPIWRRAGRHWGNPLEGKEPSERTHGHMSQALRGARPKRISKLISERALRDNKRRSDLEASCGINIRFLIPAVGQDSDCERFSKIDFQITSS
ncbi:hypothetical protein AVEN_77571-1 [Araneus ventricosus]|uniref:Uncharacterized protein n=1 Tax=Araneus ventricosus TaxID=182803 RepID=A0A4Y2UNL8_ARAVE|nr:hypothetical protein AVEN_77571-1 [Araneus ventricosus]